MMIKYRYIDEDKVNVIDNVLSIETSSLLHQKGKDKHLHIRSSTHKPYAIVIPIDQLENFEVYQ